MVGLIKTVASALAIGSSSFLANAEPIVLKPRSTNNQDSFSIKAPLVVQTSSGIVHGAINESVPLTRHFLGTPYAQSTFGKNRFRKAQPLPASAAQQTIHGNAFSPNCPQYEATPASVYTDVRREYFIRGINGDDCLSASVWAPLYPTEEKVPVIVWIYGGGQTTGGSSRTQSHIVVSLQYRLKNFFSQPNTLTENAGLYIFDARAALEWIRDNTAAFGGDPSCIVLWGQSAGATLTGALSIGWPDGPVVTGFIQDSGAVEGQGVHTVYTDTTHSNFTFLAHGLGCNGNTTSQVECMSTYPQADIEAAAYLSDHYAKLPKILEHNLIDVSGDGTRFQKDTSEAMQDLWLAFARDPENGLSNAGWPKYREGSVEVLGGEQNGTLVTHHATPKAGIEDACLITYTGN
ncbi:hypothetical protein EAF00_000963 [Botryotinia globosa]|nr:hypothetical protein EAF00_000963 [Botryotinia globosa]